MRFINAKGELDGLEHPRTYAEEVRQALSAMDGILNGDRAVYASSELTTGRRLYALLRAHGASDAAELRRKLGDDEYRRVLFEPNLAAAAAFARSLRQRRPPGAPAAGAGRRRGSQPRSSARTGAWSLVPTSARTWHASARSATAAVART